MKEQEKELLLKELQQLNKAASVLVEIQSICKSIGVKKEYSVVELVYLEALIGRFARLSDLLIRKTFRLIDVLDSEPQETVRDSINRAEKLGIIVNAEQFSEIRQMRNAIAHEYLLEDMTPLYQRVLTDSEVLLEAVRRVHDYCKRKYSL